MIEFKQRVRNLIFKDIGIPADEVEIRELNEIFEKCVKNLSPLYMRVFCVAWEARDGTTYRDLADGFIVIEKKLITEDTIKKRIERAIKELLECIRKNYF